MESHSMPLSPRAKLTVAILAMVLFTSIVVVAILRDAIVQDPQYSVSDTGIGRVSYTPDTAEVTFGVQISRAETAASALDLLNAQGSSIETALQNFGVSSGDIAVQSYSVSPYYNWSEEEGSTISGYDAYQQYVVTLHDIVPEETRVRDMISAVTNAGTNQVVSVHFTTEALDDLREEAKQLAIAAAKENAVETASGLGVKLGKVTGWWMNPIQPTYNELYYGEKGGYGGMMESSGTGYIPLGEQEVVVEATVTFEVK